MAQQLFTDIPKSASNIPGMVTPNISQDIQNTANIQDIAAAYALQQRMKADRRNEWARASAANNALRAQPQQETYLPGTETQAQGAQYRPEAGQGAVMWAPRGLDQAHLGTWAQQQQNKAIAENREMPVILQAHRNDPYSPGERGSGGPYIGRGIYGPGVTTKLGTPNPEVWGRMWGGK